MRGDKMCCKSYNSLVTTLILPQQAQDNLKWSPRSSYLNGGFLEDSHLLSLKKSALEAANMFNKMCWNHLMLCLTWVGFMIPLQTIMIIIKRALRRLLGMVSLQSILGRS